jgi:hypothetical protein
MSIYFPAHSFGCGSNLISVFYCTAILYEREYRLCQITSGEESLRYGINHGFL